MTTVYRITVQVDSVEVPDELMTNPNALSDFLDEAEWEERCAMMECSGELPEFDVQTTEL